MNSFPKLSYACPIPWANLSGDERARFCGKCGHTIANFSALDEKARLTLLAKAGSERLCVTYCRRLSGEFVTPESPLNSAERSHIKQFGIVALSAGALALAAGCMATDQAAKTNAPPTRPALAQPSTEKSAAFSEAQKLARYDTNRNGKLESDERAAMQADRAKSVNLPSNDDTLVLQAFGIAVPSTPAQTKQWLDREIQMERDQESADPGAGPFSVEGWQRYWTETLKDFRNPHSIGGINSNAEEYVRYIISQRRKFHLPELKPTG